MTLSAPQTAFPVRLTILGQPCSKANSRQIVRIKDRPASIKSPEARAYERGALMQIPPAARVRMEGPVRVTLRLYYASERPDLDESIVLDVLQDRWDRANATSDRALVQAGVYRNDRQVREKHVYHGIDKRNPRAEVMVEPMHDRSGGGWVNVVVSRGRLIGYDGGEVAA
jgi:Holliday junction resolvase RusA-like endonuclease